MAMPIKEIVFTYTQNYVIINIDNTAFIKSRYFLSKNFAVPTIFYDIRME